MRFIRLPSFGMGYLNFIHFLLYPNNLRSFTRVLKLFCIFFSAHTSKGRVATQLRFDQIKHSLHTHERFVIRRINNAIVKSMYYHFDNAIGLYVRIERNLFGQKQYELLPFHD